jgi:hypothetical protein
VTHRGWNEAKNEPKMREIPAWARDNLVLKLLDDQGLKLMVVYDRKYIDGLCNKPLIVVRRKSNPKRIRSLK